MRLQSKSLSTNWLYFGTGRYFYQVPASGLDGESKMDDGVARRRIFGIKEPCFGTNNSITPSCTTKVTASLNNVTTVPLATEHATGWYIDLDAGGAYMYDGAARTYATERVITDPVPSTTGVVYFTTFKPYADECALGGKTFLWAVDYNTGGAPGDGVEGFLKGKALMQVSTASVEQIDLSSAFKGTDPVHMGGRRTAAIEGIPPAAQGLSLLAPPQPVRRILHMIER
jgi:type IV pilus assembly protein PilY1